MDAKWTAVRLRQQYEQTFVRSSVLIGLNEKSEKQILFGLGEAQGISLRQPLMILEHVFNRVQASFILFVPVHYSFLLFAFLINPLPPIYGLFVLPMEYIFFILTNNVQCLFCFHSRHWRFRQSSTFADIIIEREWVTTAHQLQLMAKLTRLIASRLFLSVCCICCRMFSFFSNS